MAASEIIKPRDELGYVKQILKQGVTNPEEELEIYRSDPTSPLYSIKKFDELNLRQEFLRAIYQMGFEKPSKIQETALPALLEEPPVNMMAQSQSGTGKTAAFLLAALSRVKSDEHYPQVLILLPTYELAQQVATVCSRILHFYDAITVIHAVRGQILTHGTVIKNHVVIGTPGKMIDWALKYKYFDIKKIRVFILDEADIMISEQGHHDSSIRIHRELDMSCQTMLFSATFDERIIKFAEMIIQNPFIKLTLNKEELSLDNIKQFYMLTEKREEKLKALVNMYSILSVGQAIVFTATRDASNKICQILKELGQNVAVLNAEMDVEARQKTINSFRNGLERVLVTTNLCSRGIDIQQISLVINYDLPRTLGSTADFETYLHRVGRTGRFGLPGIAVNFVDPSSALDKQILEDIQEYFKKPIHFIDHNILEEVESMGA